MPSNRTQAGFTATAKQAAAFLEISVSQFNERRRLDSWEYDPQARSLVRRLDPSSPEDMAAAPGLHVVCPTLAGRKPAGGVWEYSLEHLRELRERHWPGVGR